MGVTMTGNGNVSEFSREGCFFYMPGALFQNSVIGAFKHHYRHLEARNFQFREQLSARPDDLFCAGEVAQQRAVAGRRPADY